MRGPWPPGALSSRHGHRRSHGEPRGAPHPRPGEVRRIPRVRRLHDTRRGAARAGPAGVAGQQGLDRAAQAARQVVPPRLGALPRHDARRGSARGQEGDRRVRGGQASHLGARVAQGGDQRRVAGDPLHRRRDVGRIPQPAARGQALLRQLHPRLRPHGEALEG